MVTCHSGLRVLESLPVVTCESSHCTIIGFTQQSWTQKQLLKKSFEFTRKHVGDSQTFRKVYCGLTKANIVLLGHLGKYCVLHKPSTSNHHQKHHPYSGA